MLDIYIIGPGYGEAIILRWEDEAGNPHAALIDCYAPGNGEALLEFLEERFIEHLDFVVVTHPHLDHIHNLDKVLKAYAGRIDRFWWWPGLDEKTSIHYFDLLARELGSQNRELGLKGKAIRGMLKERHLQFKKHARPESSKASCLDTIYPVGNQNDAQLKVDSFSPWESETLKFVSNVTQSIAKGNVVNDNHRESNRVSLGLLVTYGEAQIVLGGDVEEANWKALRKSKDCPQFQPCVVKVPHHGSSTGRIDGMWENGFFGCQSKNIIAVVTPWNNKLPDDMILEEIANSGARVYVTGQSERSEYQYASYVHIQVHESGYAEVNDKADNVQEYK